MYSTELTACIAYETVESNPRQCIQGSASKAVHPRQCIQGSASKAVHPRQTVLTWKRNARELGLILDHHMYIVPSCPCVVATS